jgi:hypothetical protein
LYNFVRRKEGRMNRYPKRPDGRMSRVHYLFPLAHPGPLIEPGDRVQYRGRSNPAWPTGNTPRS